MPRKTPKKPRPRLSFHLFEEETVKLANWVKVHDKTCRFADPRNCGAAGGRLTYTFGPTNLGITVKVICACKEEVNLTDYSEW